MACTRRRHLGVASGIAKSEIAYWVRRHAAGRHFARQTSSTSIREPPPMNPAILKPAVLLMSLALLCACTTVDPRTPYAQNKLQRVSAGYTGCLPPDNQIANYDQQGSDATWNASCHNRTYLCSEVSNGGRIQVSCAPTPQ
jgi:hypothetical protein